jgi:HEPN domain-containing protein
MAKSRDELKELAKCRLAEAQLLAQHGRPAGAYYLAGYAVECSLKAIIAAQFRVNEIPDRGLVNSIYTHNLSDLLRLSGLQAELQEADPDLVKSWDIVKRWSENARYVTCDPAVATAMLDAIGRDDRGIFQWLTSRW